MSSACIVCEFSIHFCLINGDKLDHLDRIYFDSPQNECAKQVLSRQRDNYM